GELENRLRHRFERSSMNRTRPVFMQFYQVQFRAVAFVLAEAILGISGAKVAHNRVPRDLRDHARGGDREAVAVPVDDGGLREGEWEYREAINEYVVGLNREDGKGEPHRLVGGAQDIDRVDLDRINDSHRPVNRIVRDEVPVNLLALLRQELL